MGRQGGVQVHVREQVDGDQVGRRREVGGETRLLTGSPVLVGVDTGGTFTDLVALVGGRLRFLKIPSTPHDPAAAVRTGVAMLGGARRLHYGSTVATNALLERRGARVVIVTTAGFEDVIEIGRQVRPALYALEPRRPEPLVPRRARLGVRERVLASGAVEQRLEKREVQRVVRAVRRSRATAVAVCLLHSYAAPGHERRLGQALAARGLHVTLSHRLLPEYREYERLSTTVVNAYVGPVMTRHLRALGAGKDRGMRVMQSSGALIPGSRACAEPVRTILSGPAGGVVGAADRARRAGFPRVITLDMGGTSTDVSLVDGVPGRRSETTVAGLPVRVPVIDVQTVGAGGGSLARLDAAGALHVGPESAGADPGPACYGRGSEPTVTDANLVLGRLVESEFLGGAMHLDRRRAELALAPLAADLRRSVRATAAGVVRVANAAMERALRRITVERGHDPRLFTLVAFGGAGGLHAAELAASLGIRRVYVPRHPGLLSAWGILTARLARHYARTLRAVEPREAVLTAGFAALRRTAKRDFRRDGVAVAGIERLLDVRYAGQSYELTVPLAPSWRDAFHRAHARLFGHADAARPVEVVTLRLDARGTAQTPPKDRAPRTGLRAPIAVRPVVFGGRPLPTPVHRRDHLASGRRFRGPLVVCEYSATTVVPPGWRLAVDRLGGLVLDAPAR